MPRIPLNRQPIPTTCYVCFAEDPHCMICNGTGKILESEDFSDDYEDRKPGDKLHKFASPWFCESDFGERTAPKML